MSPAGRNLVNEHYLKHKKVMIHSSAQYGYGYIFTTIHEYKIACFACIFPDVHKRERHTGPVPVNTLPTSAAGSLGAAEVIKCFFRYKDHMYFIKKLYFNSMLLSGGFNGEETAKNKDDPVCRKHYE